MTRGAPEINREFYAQTTPGQLDYWRLMAAPRFRMETFIRHLSVGPISSVVDLGCGNGQLLAELSARYPAASLTGIDLSEPRIEANEKAMPAITWVAVDLELPDAIHPDMHGRYDAVIASEIIEHLADPASFLKSALALARHGAGRLLLSTQGGPLRETERRVGHLRHYEAGEMGSLLERAGWRVERLWNAGWPFHDLSKWWANRSPDATMARFSERGYGPAERLVCAALRAAFRLNSGRRGAQLFAIARRPEG
jgi:cyclopropane fatty-acyl-phospholipid synthase-like methyltransferase